MRASRKAAMMAVGFPLALILALGTGVGAANAFTSEDPVTTEESAAAASEVTTKQAAEPASEAPAEVEEIEDSQSSDASQQLVTQSSKPENTGNDKPETGPPDSEPKKVFVCKYVGTPGVDERLQTGNNPISVSVNAIQNNQWDGT
ncbi:MAG: hypothetical protein WAO28_00005, partial [Candidatus Microsaccharimonas sp.]